MASTEENCGCDIFWESVRYEAWARFVVVTLNTFGATEPFQYTMWTRNEFILGRSTFIQSLYKYFLRLSCKCPVDSFYPSYNYMVFWEHIGDFQNPKKFLF